MKDYPDIPDSLHDRLGDCGPAVLSLLDTWCGMRNGNLIPGRHDFNPARVSRYLGKLYLYKFETDIGDFVCRLAGEEINEAWEFRLKGKSFRQVVSEEHHESALNRWRAIIDQPLIQYGRFTEKGRQGGERVGERLVLPLRGDSGKGEFILGIADYKVSQADRSWIKPVWDNVIRVPCADIPHVRATET